MDIITDLDPMRQWQRTNWILHMLGLYDSTSYLSHFWELYKNISKYSHGGLEGMEDMPSAWILSSKQSGNF